MARVPYSGVSSVAPSNQGTQSISVQTSADAFGASTANALGELGQAVSKSGDVIFARGLAMQELANQTAAREADMQYVIDSGKLFAEFGALEGPAKIKAFEPFQKNMDALRVKLGENLNPMARRMYDASARSTFARTIFNAAGQTAAANKKWAQSTEATNLELIVQQGKVFANDPDAFKDLLAQSEATVNRLVSTMDYPADSPQAKLMLLKQQSRLHRARIEQIGMSDPVEAQKLFLENKNQMTNEDQKAIEGFVRTQNRQLTAANIAEEEYSPKKPLDKIVESAEKRAKEAFPDDPVARKNVIKQVKEFWGTQQKLESIEYTKNLQTVVGFTQTGVRDLKELLANPEAAAAYQQLKDTDKGSIPGRINRYNASVNQESDQRAVDYLNGLRFEDNKAFIETDFTKYTLNQTLINKFNELRRKDIANPPDKPRLEQSIDWMRSKYGPTLHDLGIYTRTKQNAEKYFQYVGALNAAVEAWTEQTKRPPSYDDFMKHIAPGIINTRTESGWFGMLFGGVARRGFDQDMPKGEARDVLVKQLQQRLGRVPDEREIAGEYMKRMFKGLYQQQKANDRIKTSE